MDFISKPYLVPRWFVFKPFSGLMRHTTITDIFKVANCNTFSLAVLVFISLLGRNYNWNGIFIIPISILVIHYCIIFVIPFLVRVLIKMTFGFITNSFGEKRNVLIFGAGAMVILVKQIIQTDCDSGYTIMGLMTMIKRYQSLNERI